MNQNDSMGFVETIGLVAAIEAADVMIKSANVKVASVANADSGLITVICTGDLASCSAAVDAAKASVAGVSTCFCSNRIPRPSSEVAALVDDHIGNMILPQPAPKAKKTKKTKK